MSMTEIAQNAGSPLGDLSHLHCEQGRRLHEAGSIGTAWRVVSGSIRLDALTGPDDTPVFAGMAVAGDVVGAESLLVGYCYFRATAMTPTELAAWPGAALQGPTLLAALAQAEQRTARLLGLRTGQAFDRVNKLIHMLVPQFGQREVARIALPSLRDMADITSLTIETVSRAISGLRRQGVFQPDGQRRGFGAKTGQLFLP